MIRKSSILTRTSATAAVCAQLRAMRARLTSLTARQSWCGRISAMALVIVCLAAPQEPSPLKNERHLHMMRRPCRKARRKRNYRKR